MSSSRDEDLDWLYGGETASKQQPERTRVHAEPVRDCRTRRTAEAGAILPGGPCRLRSPTAPPRSSPPARRADLVDQAGYSLLGPRGGGVRFGSSCGCCDPAALFILWLVAVPAYAWTRLIVSTPHHPVSVLLINQARLSVGGFGLPRRTE